MAAEGVTFKPGVNVGVDVEPAELLKQYDAVVLTGGAEWPRDLEVPGRELDGVHFAMDFLTQQNRRVAGDAVAEVGAIDWPILAKDKHVIVIGGGDTGSDCIGTSLRQGAKSVTQLEILPRPPDEENKLLTWPDWPLKFRTSSSQEEGALRDFAVVTRKLSGENGKVKALHAVRVEWVKDAEGRMVMQDVPNSEMTQPADLVLLAMGFVGPRQNDLLKKFGVKLDGRGNVAATVVDYKTSVPNLFSAGDMRRGQSLVVWAIREGRPAARAVDLHLMGRTDLPR